MIPVAPLAAFAVAAGLLTITPGLDTALVLRTAAAEGGRRAAEAALGICLGVLVWGIAAAFGVAALMAASTPAYTMLRWAGAAYLLYLGVSMLRRPRASFSVDAPDAPATRTSRSWFGRGLLTNLLNPKVGVFYVTFMPQFVPRGAANASTLMVTMATIHAVEGILWFAALIWATARLARFLRRPRVVSALDRITGVVLVGFGVRLAIEST